MGITLEQVVPWGRSMQEYIRMFDLTSADLNWNILDCASGPASFNAEMRQQGHSVISCDPLYQFSVAEIADRIQAACPAIIQRVEANPDNFVWREIQSPTHLAQVRMTAMQHFLKDFPAGLQEKRYLAEELPSLPFATGQFDLALCSHFLFTYSDQLSAEFHLASIREMGRVAREVRIFPLLVNMNGELSPLLQPVMTELEKQAYQVEIKPVPYEFQKGGNQLLCICSEVPRDQG